MSSEQNEESNPEKKDVRYPLLVILGPTAVGKTKLSLEIARKFNGEIISADSMQIYKNMDIGTAKATPAEQKEVPHHMINIVSPEQEFSVADFQEKVDKLIPEICSRNNLPMLVGGTGLYIKAVVQGFLLPEMEKDEKLRINLERKAKNHGNQYVHNLLAEVDPELAEKLHPNDLRRVIRGIEIYRQTGHTKTYFKKKQAEKPDRYNTLKVGLKRDRKELYERINLRVEQMIDQGLIDEVKELIKNKNYLSATALQGLGYKEIIGYLNGEYDLDEALRILKRDTRHLAKRQLTWFRRDDKIHWFNLSNLNWQQAFENISQLINKNLK